MAEATDVVLPLPPNAPRVRPNAFTRWLGRTVLRLGGWRMAMGLCVMMAGVVTLSAPLLIHAPAMHDAMAALGCRSLPT